MYNYSVNLNSENQLYVLYIKAYFQKNAVRLVKVRAVQMPSKGDQLGTTVKGPGSKRNSIFFFYSPFTPQTCTDIFLFISHLMLVFI